MIEEHHKTEILGLFEDADLELIEKILYFDGWSDYEESGGILVFEAIDGTIQIVDYGYWVMMSDEHSFFPLREVTFEEAQKEIADMEKAIASVNLHS
jgi:hypothetical protein